MEYTSGCKVGPSPLLDDSLERGGRDCLEAGLSGGGNMCNSSLDMLRGDDIIGRDIFGRPSLLSADGGGGVLARKLRPLNRENGDVDLVRGGASCSSCSLPSWNGELCDWLIGTVSIESTVEFLAPGRSVFEERREVRFV